VSATSPAEPSPTPSGPDLGPLAADVVVVGSGASGLVAALAAATAGASVTVMEKAAVFGGTSVVSGGSMWVPGNRFMGALGIPDSRDDACAYVRAVSLGRVPDPLLVAFVDTVNPLLEFLTARTPLEFTANARHPDYQPHLPGAKPAGRTVQVGLYDSKRLGDLQPLLRKGHSTVPVTRDEFDTWGEQTLDRWDWALIAQRTGASIVGMGEALVGGLLEACVDVGVRLHVGYRAMELLRDDERVAGVVAAGAGGQVSVLAARGVVLASGGFEWDEGYVRQFLGVPMVAPGSPPANEGDGLRMAMKAGAALGNMTEAWWAPMLEIVGDEYDERPLYRPTSGLRALPGSIIVNRRGRRFVDEAMNYNDLTKAMMHFDPVAYDYVNIPAYLVFDERFRRSYSVGTVTPDAPTPRWMLEAATLGDLATSAGIDPHGFVAQVDEFNEHARSGEDPVFHRGESVYDRYRGDASVLPHCNTRPVGEGPYYAVELRLGCLGTKGGPLTDENGQVLDLDGGSVRGLYACGNAAASVFGPGYPGAGATLAAGMTFGYLIGNALATVAAVETSA
jgi:3-oxosteroid 1-dehydrogenase